MAKKTPQKAWMKQKESKAENRAMINYPFLHDDDESIRLRAVIRGKKDDNEE